MFTQEQILIAMAYACKSHDNITQNDVTLVNHIAQKQRITDEVELIKIIANFVRIDSKTHALITQGYYMLGGRGIFADKNDALAFFNQKIKDGFFLGFYDENQTPLQPNYDDIDKAIEDFTQLRKNSPRLNRYLCAYFTWYDVA